ncbi:MAG: zinc-ribbon domain-containing protein [Anaerorhabdus sp.]|uniref:zinc-ribbon domain-containing protein n=1 Tax=Anaerorhabdus sp. TaxID=1872524 RepID=UPI002FC88386
MSEDKVLVNTNQQYCKKCGKIIDIDSVFCKHCGSPLIIIDENKSFNTKESIVDQPTNKKGNTGKWIFSLLLIFIIGFYLVASEMMYQDAYNEYKACVVGNDQRIRNSNSNGMYYNVYSCSPPNRIDYYRLW